MFRFLNDLIRNYNAYHFERIYIVVARRQCDLEAYLEYKNIIPLANYVWTDGGLRRESKQVLDRYRHKNILVYQFNGEKFSLDNLEHLLKIAKNDIDTNVPIHWRFITGINNESDFIPENVVKEIEKNLVVQRDTIEIFNPVDLLNKFSKLV